MAGMGRNGAVQKITLDAKAGEVSAEPVCRGVAADARVHAPVEVVADADLPPMAAVAGAGGGFDWLAQEPDL